MPLRDCLISSPLKAFVLAPQRPQGAITSLTPLTSERAKFEYKKNTYSKKSYFLSKCFFVFRCYISEIY